jgi:hypothetical protein
MGCIAKLHLGNGRWEMPTPTGRSTSLNDFRNVIYYASEKTLRMLKTYFARRSRVGVASPAVSRSAEATQIP